jgi:hypothetical protein
MQVRELMSTAVEVVGRNDDPEGTPWCSGW